MNKEIYIEHLKHIINRLEREESPNWKEHLSEYDFLFPFYPYYHDLRNDLRRELRGDLREIKESISEMKNCCAANHDTTKQLITLQGSTKKTTKYLKDRIKDCENLTICDPYIFKSYNNIYNSEDDYIKTILGILPKELRELNIYHDKNNTKIFIMKAFEEYCTSKNIKFKFFSTNLLHDRVWIKDNNTALAVGTSFNSLGNKLAFILDLPQEDLKEFKHQLFEIRSQSI